MCVGKMYVNVKKDKNVSYISYSDWPATSNCPVRITFQIFSRIHYYKCPRKQTGNGFE
jgi:hypothetical protein